MISRTAIALLALSAVNIADIVPVHAQPKAQVFFGVRPESCDMPGAPVGEVVPGGTAAALGLQKDDLVTSVNGVPIASTDDMIARIQGLQVGQRVSVKVRRAGQTLELSAEALAGTPIVQPRRVPQ